MAESSVIPPFCKSLELFFNYTPEEPATFNDQGCPAEAEFTHIEYNGQPVSKDLEDVLFEALWTRVEAQILSGEAKKWAA